MYYVIHKGPRQKNTYTVLGRNVDENNHLEDGRILLKLFLNKWDSRAWNGLIWPRIWKNCEFFP
jgi:hypothetical protein